MTGRPPSIGVRRSALDAWADLQRALLAAGPVPCLGRDEWTSDDPAARGWAAGRCRGCPVIGECRQFADANEERYGVWAGVDRTNGMHTRRKTA